MNAVLTLQADRGSQVDPGGSATICSFMSGRYSVSKVLDGQCQSRGRPSAAAIYRHQSEFYNERSGTRIPIAMKLTDRPMSRRGDTPSGLWPALLLSPSHVIT